MDFKTLGPIRAVNDRLAYTPSAPKVKQVLALLVMRANQIVSLDSILDELWGEALPRTAVTTAQTYIYQLRKDFIKELGADPRKRAIVTTPPGYLLHTPEDSLDTHHFTRLADEAQACYTAHDVGGAVRWAEEALALCRGAPLADVPCGRTLRNYVSHLDEQRVRVRKLRIQAAMALGRHGELITDLRSLVMEYPYDEWFHAQLMLALGKAGRRGEALHVYHRVRRLLRNELGLDPSQDLRLAQEEVLKPAS
ncbi:AfsR/SARP family transcriptional regulator [Streptomyces corynorhini]|uniref:Transcriptional regulator n=1 Tax=Streptomyces corynorhini TaxID=2282652 RepID=A0A370B9X0_9ACTN|nr:AfsR/SARP family transcriptional regulator [Streptomyces corynorhini]RDG36593.1 transcriptional regulator [Streptomyces corynorhini]